MIQSVNEAEQMLATNTSDITFATDDIRTRSANCNFPGWLQHAEGTSTYTILDGGLYEIDFNTNVSSATVGAVALGLKSNGILIPGTKIGANIATANEYSNVSFAKTIRICARANTVLTVGSVADFAGAATTAPTVRNANLSITRIA